MIQLKITDEFKCPVFGVGYILHFTCVFIFTEFLIIFNIPIVNKYIIDILYILKCDFAKEQEINNKNKYLDYNII